MGWLKNLFRQVPSLPCPECGYHMRRSAFSSSDQCDSCGAYSIAIMDASSRRPSQTGWSQVPAGFVSHKLEFRLPLANVRPLPLWVFPDAGSCCVCGLSATKVTMLAVSISSGTGAVATTMRREFPLGYCPNHATRGTCRDGGVFWDYRELCCQGIDFYNRFRSLNWMTLEDRRRREEVCVRCRYPLKKIFGGLHEACPECRADQMDDLADVVDVISGRRSRLLQSRIEAGLQGTAAGEEFLFPCREIDGKAVVERAYRKRLDALVANGKIQAADAKKWSQ